MDSTIHIKVKACFVIHCATHFSFCEESVTVEGYVHLADSIDIDSVPSCHDIVDGSDYELPKGWSSVYGAKYCTSCTKRKK